MFLLSIFLTETKVFATESHTKYTKENISNYFSGILSINQNNNENTFKYLKKVKPLQDKHTRFNIEYLRTLVLLEKFEDAFFFSKSLLKNKQSFFESDLLLGLEYFQKKRLQKCRSFF